MNLLTLVQLLAAACLACSQPLISRVSSGSAAAPNDTVVLAGIGLAGCSALLCPLSGSGPCLSLPPQPSSWDGGLKVTVPAGSAPAAYSVAACCGAACSNATQAQRYSLNAPRAAWALGTGDAPGAVEAGGTLRVVGAALALNPATGACAPLAAATTDYAPGALGPGLFPPGAAAALAAAPSGTATAAWLCPASGGGASCTALPPPLLASCHRLDLAIPAATPPGAYSLRLHNGLAASNQGLGVLEAELALTVTPPRALPASPALTVGLDCGVAECLAAAKAAGGGRVHLPAGTWDLPAGAALELAAGTTLTGEGPASVLRFGANTLAAPLPSALTCTGPSLLANLTLLIASPAVNALVYGSGSSGCRGEGLAVTVDTLAGFPGWGVGPAFSTASASGSWALQGSTLLHRGNCSAQQSWPHNTAYTLWGTHDGLFANNTVLCYCQGHSTDSSQRLFLDGNAVFSLGADSQGSGFSTFENAQVLEHLYIGRSLDVGNPGAVKRWESMTLDGPGGAIFDTFAQLSSDGAQGEAQTLTLRQPARSGPYGDRNISAQYLGASVAVLAGPGLGGTARVVGFVPTNASWQAALQLRLQPPLLTRPQPGASWLAVNPFRGAMVFEGNSMVNDTTWQLWAQATDVLLAGSYFSNFNGGSVLNWPLFYQCPWGNGGPGGFSCAWQPNIGTDFLGNTLRCLGSMGVITSDYAGLPPVNLTLGLGLTRRGNVLLGGTAMAGSGRVDDVLVEHTVFGEAVCKGVLKPAGEVDFAPGVQHVLVR